MRKIIILLVTLIFGVLGTYAEDGIVFQVQKINQKDISSKVAEELDLKIKQIMTRNSAMAENEYNIFVVEPELGVPETVTTNGLVKNVSVAKGELTLTTKNTIDGMVYYSVVIPLKGTATGDSQAALLDMVKSIKTTSTEYTRFVRLSRKKIAEYYVNNCEGIVRNGIALYESGRETEALQYMSVLSSDAPCYQTFVDFMDKINGKEEDGATEEVAAEEVSTEEVSTESEE